MPSNIRDTIKKKKVIGCSSVKVLTKSPTIILHAKILTEEATSYIMKANFSVDLLISRENKIIG